MMTLKHFWGTIKTILLSKSKFSEYILVKLTKFYLSLKYFDCIYHYFILLLFLLISLKKEN